MPPKQNNTHIPRTMITLDQPGASFGLRAAAVAIHNGYVLLQHAKQDGFWFLPGGRCELLESAQSTIHREMSEELGIQVSVKRLLWVLENFFVEDNVACHELGLYFLIDLGPEFAHYGPGAPFERDDDGLKLTFCWFPIDTLHTIPLYPTFLQEALGHLPAHVEHVVHRDD